jgi:chemotaxis protein methyltransferase CheR
VISLALETRAGHELKNARSISAEQFAYVRQLLHGHAGIVLEDGKEYLVESRLGNLAIAEGFASLPLLIECLRSRPTNDLHRKVVEGMTNNETSFFRDSRPFAMLQQGVLPDLAARRRSERALNIWCAASSTGQEPYSIAMLLQEQVPSLNGWNIRLLATDICRDALGRARAGLYTPFEIGRGLPASLLAKHFERHGGFWLVHPALRRCVEFQEMNLADSWPALPKMDLIVMRNVLIYLDPEMRKQILAKAARLLAPGGYLMLGGAETLTGVADAFVPVSFEGATCFRLKGGRVD